MSRRPRTGAKPGVRILAVFAKNCPHCEKMLSTAEYTALLRNADLRALDVERMDDHDVAMIFAHTSVDEHLTALREGKWSVKTPTLYVVHPDRIDAFAGELKRAQMAVLSAEVYGKLVVPAKRGRRGGKGGGE